LSQVAESKPKIILESVAQFPHANCYAGYRAKTISFLQALSTEPQSNPDSSVQDSGMLKSKILFIETHESY
jgi:hypothetical protein